MKYIAKSPLTVTVITDTHYYSSKIGTEGAAYDTANMRSQKLLTQSAPLLEAAFDQIAADTRGDIVLLSGDVTNNGEVCSHREFIELLRSLALRGKRVFVITATHDYNESGVTTGYQGDETIRIPAVKRKQLFDMYKEFGPEQSLSVYQEGMSYCAQLAEGYRLLAINDDVPLDEAHRAWIERQTAAAQQEGQLLLAMTHHPLIAPSPMYELIGKNDINEEHKAMVAWLADLGVQFMFTGHTHIHDISAGQSPRGNVLYDICGASLVGYPAAMRSVCFDAANGTVHVHSDLITQPVPFDLGGENLQEYLKSHLIGVIRDMIFTAARDVDALAYKAVAISIKPKLVYKFGWLIKPIARLLCRLKVKTVARWTKKETGLNKRDYADIADDLVVNHVIGIVLSLFAGERKHPPESAYYKITVGFLNILDSLLQALHIPIANILKIRPTIKDMIEPLLWKNGFDAYEADLPIMPYYPEGESGAGLPEQEKIETVRPSRKGKGIILCCVLILLLLLPLLPLAALIFGGSYMAYRVKYRDKLK